MSREERIIGAKIVGLALVIVSIFLAVVFCIFFLSQAGPNVTMYPMLNDGHHIGKVVSIDKKGGPLILFNVEDKGPVEINCVHPYTHDIGNLFDLAKPGMIVDFIVKDKNIISWKWKFKDI